MTFEVQRTFDGLEAMPDTMCADSEHVMLVEESKASARNRQCAVGGLEEPIRRMRLCHPEVAPKPKRFFRTFWIGIVTRAVAKSRRKEGLLHDLRMELQ
jgi:hypothetical protein